MFALRRTATLPLRSPSLAPALTAALTAARSWAERRQTRKALAHLNDHLLSDIGLTRRDAREEAARLF